VVLDTETTGLDPAQGHRVVEIGAVELVNHVPSGRYFHKYLNPERGVPAEAVKVHGLTAEFLRDKPRFDAIAGELEEFLCEDRLVIHNAGFDLAFLNAELGQLARRRISAQRVVDTLTLARQKNPSAPNSLDALCKRFGIDNARRTKHGALLDAELLAEVYLELIGGRQASLMLAGLEPGRRTTIEVAAGRRQRDRPLPPRLTEQEVLAHAALIGSLGEAALWRKWLTAPISRGDPPIEVENRIPGQTGMQ
jgi:DNA polymerase-3 subunit epsilon